MKVPVARIWETYQVLTGVEDQATLPGDRVPPKYMIFGILEPPDSRRRESGAH